MLALTQPMAPRTTQDQAQNTGLKRATTQAIMHSSAMTA